MYAIPLSGSSKEDATSLEGIASESGRYPLPPQRTHCIPPQNTGNAAIGARRESGGDYTDSRRGITFTVAPFENMIDTNTTFTQSMVLLPECDARLHESTIQSTCARASTGHIILLPESAGVVKQLVSRPARGTAPAQDVSFS